MNIKDATTWYAPITLALVVLVLAVFITLQEKPGEKPDTMLGTGNANQSLTWGVGGLDKALGSDDIL